MPSEQLQRLVEGLKNLRRNAPASIHEMREAAEAAARFIPPPDGVDIEPVEAGGVPADWLRPAGAEDGRTVFYVHGGGYVFGSSRTHRALAARIAQSAGARSLIFDYRLAPEHTFPAALDDTIAAWKWALAQGVDPARAVFAGDSAGGGLAVAAMTVLRDEGVALPAAAVLLSPWTDLSGASPSIEENAGRDPLGDAERSRRWTRLYLNGTDVRDPLASPVYADLRGLPPLLIQASEIELIRDDAVRLAQNAHAAGVEAQLDLWPEMIHVWHFYAHALPEAREAIAQIGQWTRAKVKP